MKWQVLASVVFLLAAAVAAAEPIAIELPQRTTPVDFEKEVLPVLRANCLACHNAQKAEAKLVLETPQSILAGGEQGPAVVPKKSDESLLLKVAAHQQESFMPPADNVVGAKSLTPQQLGLIKLWIDEGAGGTVSSSRTIRWQPLPTGHQPIFAAAVTPDGQYAVCSRGNQLSVYHVPSGKLAAKLIDPDLEQTAHRDVIRSMAFNAAGDLLATGGFREVKLWRRPRLARQAEWIHEGAITTAVASADGKLAATADENNAVRVWETASGKTLQTLAHPAAVSGIAFSSDGGTLYTSSDKLVRAWKVADGAAIGKPVETAATIQSLALIHGGEWLLTGESDGVVRVWETKSVRGEAGEDIKPLKEIKSHEGPVTAICAIADKPNEFLGGGQDGRLKVFDAESVNMVRELRHDAPVASIAISSDGKRIASVGGSRAKLWKENGEPIELADPRPATRLAETDAQIAFSKSAIDLAKQEIKSYEGTERRVMVTAMDIKKAEEERDKAQKMLDEKKAALEKAKADEKDPKKLEAAENQVKEAETAVAVANTVIERAKIVAERAVQDFAKAKEAVAAREEVLKQQEAAKAAAVTAKQEAKPAFNCVAFAADGQRIFVGGEDGAIHSFTAESGLPLETSVEHMAAVKALSFSSDERLLSASSDKRSLMFSAPSQWKLERSITDGLVDRVLAVDFSRDGQLLATGGGLPSRSGELKIWKVADGSLVREISNAHADTVFSVRFSPDGQHLASAGANRLVKVFNVASGEQVRSFAGHTAHVLGVNWKADGKLLVSCGTDQSIKLWDFEKGLPVRTLKGNTYQIGPYRREVTAALFIGDSEQVLAASGDGTVRLHRITLDQDILTYSGSKGYQYAAAATPDGQTLIVGGADGILRRWKGQDRDVKQSFEP